MTLKFGYWKIRGLSSNIRYQLAYSGVDYEMIEYEQGDAPDFNSSCWFDVKPTLGLAFPNLPYLIDGDHSMTETMAIHKYLADKYKPELLGTTPQERGLVNMLAGVVSDLKNAVTGPCYGSGDKNEINA